jgi:hypothetical protein
MALSKRQNNHRRIFSSISCHAWLGKLSCFSGSLNQNGVKTSYQFSLRQMRLVPGTQDTGEL